MKLLKLLIFLLFSSFTILGCSNVSEKYSLYVEELSKNLVNEKNDIVCIDFDTKPEIHARFVKEAKRRGLNCEQLKEKKYKNLKNQLKLIAQETKEQTLNPVKIYTYNNCDNYPNLCSNSQLCLKATRGNNWESGIQYLPYVNEAKKRGLLCTTNKEIK